ncbi:hypothetical protein, partial [Neisseria sp. P0007.S010]
MKIIEVDEELYQYIA